MQLGDLSKPGDKKKLIAAGALGLVAILFLWWTFVGFGSSSTTATARPSPTPTPRSPGYRPTQPANDSVAKASSYMQEIVSQPSNVTAPAPQRNIFAYYVVVPKPSPVVIPPTPTPTPPPPLLLLAVAPSSVYARTSDFNLEVTGDKFTPAMRIYVDQREMPTKYKSPQQVSTTIPASMIMNPGPHNVMVQLPDKSLFSNTQSFNVGAPPVPNYSYIGLVSSPTRVDIAYLQDKGNKDVLTVQRGDVLSGRFRVTSISDKEVLFVDTNLKIRHSVARSEGERTAGSPLIRPTPRVDAEDDEP